ncbi:hypothetical protein HDU89_008754 [Geranomyces variabilis]|nr:hypothetical protein HDU89_008754 [Geranomyces variabilis]
MFIERVAELGLLEHDSDSNILSGFPLGVQKTLIAQVTHCLLPAPPPSHAIASPAPQQPELLTSPAHVRWAMEIVGQGFALPIEDSGVIWMTVAVYESWLLDKRPVGIDQASDTAVEQRFWQTIFEQFSLLFQPRPRSEMQQNSWIHDRTKSKEHHPVGGSDEPELLGTHVELCHAVLRIVCTAGRTLGARFSEETWIVLLKVMMGAADCLLREPVAELAGGGFSSYFPADALAKADRHQTVVVDADEPAPRMADELCEHIVRVLLELWLRSKLMSVYMWDNLKRLFALWTHRVKVIHQWNATILGLSQRVVGLLYGHAEGADRVYIDVSGMYSVTLELPSEFLVYAWHRLIYILGNPNTLPAPNFELAIQGIGRVIHVWHTIGADDGPIQHDAPSVPDGNTLLHMFGAWLFEATTQVPLEYADGKAAALGILCRIFCQPQRRSPFQATYLERFYTALKEGLRSDPESLTAILMNSCSLFTQPLHGLRILVPDFVIALKRVLNSGIPTTAELRRCAYSVASCILPLPNHFRGVFLGPAWDRYEMYGASADDPLVARTVRAMYAKAHDGARGESGEPLFRQLKHHLGEILLLSLHSESAPSNSRYLLHLVSIFVAEDAPFCPGLPALVVRCIQEKLTAWPPDVVKTAFQTLNGLAGYYKYLRRDNKSCPKELVMALCRYIDNHLADDNLVAAQSLVIAAYDCMTRWVVCGQWIVEERATLLSVIATLSRGIAVLDREEEFAAVGDTDATVHSAGNHAIASSNTASGGVTPAPLHSSTQRDVHAIAGAAGNGANLLAEKKKVPRHGMAASKLIPKLRSQPAHTKDTEHKGGGFVSTGTKDAGLGLPTFASLTAEMMIKGAAEMALSRMANQLGNFPPYGERTGVSSVSSIWSEEAELQRIVKVRRQLQRAKRKPLATGNADDTAIAEDDAPVTLQDYKRYIRYYAFDKRTVLGILETPAWATSTPQRTPAMTMILRDSSGKYTWMSSMKYVEDDNAECTSVVAALPFDSSSELNQKDRPQPLSYPYAPRNAAVCNLPSVNDSAIPSLDSGEETDRWRDAVARTAATRPQPHALAKTRTTADPPQAADPMDPETPTASFRLFLAQTGYLAAATRGQMWPLPITDALLAELRRIDTLPERDCIPVTVLFARCWRDGVADMLKGRTVTRDFDEFVHCLGWPVDLATHRGYNGGSWRSQKGTACYFASKHVEVVFNVPYYSPAAGADAGVEDMYLVTPTVCVVWLEDGYRHAALQARIVAAGCLAQVYIFIVPIHDGLFCIKVGKVGFGEEDKTTLGPIIDGAVISRHSLGTLVRATAVRAHASCRASKGNYRRPGLVRRHDIEGLCNKFRATQGVGRFCADLFS